MDYSSFILQIGGTLEVTVTDSTSATPFVDPLYNDYLPQAISDAELRIYRDLDLLLTRVTDTTGVLTPNSRDFTLPTSQGVFVVLEEISVIYQYRKQPPMMPVSKQYLDSVWPDDLPPYNLTPRITQSGEYRVTQNGALRLALITETTLPTMWCPKDQTSIRVAPPPDQAYPVSCFGTIRPATLSASNTSTILTTWFPDLFFAASMQSWSAFQRDFGQGSDDPTKALSWGAVYDKLKASAEVEELRKKVRSVGGTTLIPSPLTPGR